jgi:hypothetical protein
MVRVPNSRPHFSRKIEEELFKKLKTYLHVADDVHYYHANLQCEITYILGRAKLTKKYKRLETILWIHMQEG